jgi:hypothetical protein
MVGNVVSLGHFINNASVSENKGKKGSTTKQMYFAQIYNDGTMCELTGKLRKTEVRVSICRWKTKNSLNTFSVLLRQ